MSRLLQASAHHRRVGRDQAIAALFVPRMFGASGMDGPKRNQGLQPIKEPKLGAPGESAVGSATGHEPVWL